MFAKRLFKVALLGISLFALLTLVGNNLEVLAALVTPTPPSGGPFTSPLPTPPARPTPPPTPTTSPQARIALRYIPEREGMERRVRCTRGARAARRLCIPDERG